MRKNSGLLNIVRCPQSTSDFATTSMPLHQHLQPSDLQKISLHTCMTTAEHMKYVGKNVSELLASAKSPSSKCANWMAGTRFWHPWGRLGNSDRSQSLSRSGPGGPCQATPEKTSPSLHRRSESVLRNGLLSLNEVSLCYKCTKRDLEIF